jgi:hypothetical protein
MKVIANGSFIDNLKGLLLRDVSDRMIGFVTIALATEMKLAAHHV